LMLLIDLPKVTKKRLQFPMKLVGGSRGGRTRTQFLLLCISQ